MQSCGPPGIEFETNELDTITSNMGTIFSNTLETVAPIELKKVREKRAVPWYNSYTHSLKKETHNREYRGQASRSSEKHGQASRD